MAPPDEIYPNAPLVLTAFEIRHPMTDPLTTPERRALKEFLPSLPIMRSARHTEVQANLDGSPPASQSEEFPKFLNRESTMAATFRSSSMVVECSDYHGWAEFSILIREAISARMTVAPVDGYERLGLRYIDEIRVPEPATWSDWIQPQLLGPDEVSAILGLPFQGFQGVAVYGDTPGHAFALRFGPRNGFAIDPNWDLRRKQQRPGDFFLIDIDSFWTPPDGVPELDADSVMDKAEKLHTPVRGLFESAITDRYRDEILRNGG